MSIAIYFPHERVALMGRTSVSFFSGFERGGADVSMVHKKPSPIPCSGFLQKWPWLIND